MEEKPARKSPDSLPATRSPPQSFNSVESNMVAETNPESTTVYEVTTRETTTTLDDDSNSSTPWWWKFTLKKKRGDGDQSDPVGSTFPPWFKEIDATEFPTWIKRTVTPPESEAPQKNKVVKRLRVASQRPFQGQRLVESHKAEGRENAADQGPRDLVHGDDLHSNQQHQEPTNSKLPQQNLPSKYHAAREPGKSATKPSQTYTKRSNFTLPVLQPLFRSETIETKGPNNMHEIVYTVEPTSNPKYVTSAANNIGESGAREKHLEDVTVVVDIVEHDPKPDARPPQLEIDTADRLDQQRRFLNRVRAQRNHWKDVRSQNSKPRKVFHRRNRHHQQQSPSESKRPNKIFQTTVQKTHRPRPKQVEIHSVEEMDYLENNVQNTNDGRAFRSRNRNSKSAIETPPNARRFRQQDIKNAFDAFRHNNRMPDRPPHYDVFEQRKYDVVDIDADFDDENFSPNDQNEEFLPKPDHDEKEPISHAHPRINQHEWEPRLHRQFKPSNRRRQKGELGLSTFDEYDRPEFSGKHDNHEHDRLLQPAQRDKFDARSQPDKQEPLDSPQNAAVADAFRPSTIHTSNLVKLVESKEPPPFSTEPPPTWPTKEVPTPLYRSRFTHSSHGYFPPDSLLVSHSESSMLSPPPPPTAQNMSEPETTEETKSAKNECK